MVSRATGRSGQGLALGLRTGSGVRGSVIASDALGCRRPSMSAMVDVALGWARLVRAAQREARNWVSPAHIVVLESDDWGLEGNPTAAAATRLDEALRALLPSSTGRGLNWFCYCRETPQDLRELYAVIGSHRERRGRHPVFTANVVLSRPDWHAMEARGFTRPAYVRYDRSPDAGDARLVRVWREGVTDGVFAPQIHGLSHVNLALRLHDARRGEDPLFQLASGLRSQVSGPAVYQGRMGWYNKPYLDLSSGGELPAEEIQSLVTEAAEAFEGIFGRTSQSTIAPAYGWGENTERAWRTAGIRYIQGGNRQVLSSDRWEEDRRLANHPLGALSTSGQVYLVRNCDFEPYLGAEIRSAVQACLTQVARAFDLGLPATISTHSVNYVAGLRPTWAAQCRAGLDDLLSSIERQWPDVLYLTSPELGEVILDGHFHDFFTGEVVCIPGGNRCGIVRHVGKVLGRRWSRSPLRRKCSMHCGRCVG